MASFGNSRSTLEHFAIIQGWDQESMIELLTRYIDNQQNNDAFADFLQQEMEEENTFDPEFDCWSDGTPIEPIK